MIIPRVGDVWKFKLPGGGKTIKTITEIKWKDRKSGQGRYPYIIWSHTPKARYVNPVSVRNLLSSDRCGRLIKAAKRKHITRLVDARGE